MRAKHDFKGLADTRLDWLPTPVYCLVESVVSVFPCPAISPESSTQDHATLHGTAQRVLSAFLLRRSKLTRMISNDNHEYVELRLLMDTPRA